MPDQRKEVRWKNRLMLIVATCVLIGLIAGFGVEKDHFPERSLFPGLTPVFVETTSNGLPDVLLGSKTIYYYSGWIHARYRANVDGFNRSIDQNLKSRGWTRRVVEADGGSVWVSGTRQLVFIAQFPDGTDHNDPKNRRQITHLEVYDTSTSLGERIKAVLKWRKP